MSESNNSSRAVKIWVPWNNRIGHAEHDTLRARMCEVFGGFTETRVVGGWVNDAGETVMEPVSIYLLVPFFEHNPAGEVNELIARILELGEEKVLVATVKADFLLFDAEQVAEVRKYTDLLAAQNATPDPTVH